jgi:uncharacterized protein YegL
MSSTEPSVNDLSPIVNAGVEKEPMLLLDTSGSMSWPAAEGASAQRLSVIGEALGRIVEVLGAEDSQAEGEAAAGEDAGGLMTILFSDHAESIDDLSSANWKRKWDDIQWGGGTQIMPGWNLLVDTFLEEFGDRPKQDRPALLALVITDGEATDAEEFAAEIAKIQGTTYVCVAVLGFGADHDATLASYRKIEASNKHLRVVTFGGQTDPTEIADDLLKLLQ